MSAKTFLKSVITVLWLRRLTAGMSLQRPGFKLDHFLWDLWWTEWYWDRFFSEYLGVLSASFHRCSVSHIFLCRLAVCAGYADGMCDEKQIFWMCQTLHNKLQHSSTLTLFHYRVGRNF